ncbi:MAG: hypothetical protein ACYC09_11190 [Bacteroidota bacterium]|jgi:hypothetical protein
MQNLQQIMGQYPDLTTHGFGIDRGWNYDFESERQELKNHETEFQACVNWLSQHRVRYTINRRIGHTHRLKHIAERDIPNTYIPEGVLIAAALALNIPYRRIRKKTSVYLGLSSRRFN